MDKGPNSVLKWTVSVPELLDVAVRMHLAQGGLKKGDLSKFVVEALETHLAGRNVEAVQERNEKADFEELHQAVKRAVNAVRAEEFGVRP